METILVELDDGRVLEAVPMGIAEKYGLDDHDAMGDKTPEFEIEAMEADHVASENC